jgi:serine/threonine-protein kinase
MGEVWEAEDVELRRSVAIKLLVTPLQADPSLAENFRSEARVEAALKHPNIAEVLDWGHDGSTTYVVTELLGGRTLRDVLDLEGPAPWQLTARVGLQIAGALAYAHAAGYAHGTLSAERIMLSPDGHATLLGFGIACRGFCESPPSADADAYALGGVLYEMLTGASPFEARPAELPDNEPWPRPVRAIAPETPRRLGEIVMRSVSPDPAERYATAADLEADLARFLSPPDHRWIWLTAAVFAVIAAVLLTLALTAVRTIVVPDVTGRTTTEAAAILARAGLRLVVTGQAPSSDVATKTIVAENPGAGQRVRRGTQIGVVVSSGLPKSVVPSVVGSTLQAASGQIASAGFVVGNVKRANSNTYPADSVISAFPEPGSSAPVGSRIDLVVSAGQATVTMPDVRGVWGADAVDKLTALGLKVDTGEQFSTQASGTVVSQAPEPGTTVAAGGTVVISISRGPSPVTIPDLIGSAPSVAQNTLERMGLVPIMSTEASGTDPAHRGIVVRTDPPSGTSVGPGTRVAVTIGN